MSYDIQLRNLNIPNTFTKDTDIRDILSDIQTNFEILKHSSLWKGEKGDSLTPKIVNLDALVDSTITNEAPFNTLEALKTLYLKIVQPIVDQSSDQVSFGDRRLLWVLDYLNPATTPSMKENIKNSHRQFMPGNIVLMVDENNKVFYSNHYVFVDPRFRNNLVTPPNNQQDLSCALLASPEGADYKFTAYNAFPQVAYNKTTNTYTWKMNGVVTAIPVMGQKGEPGKSVNNQFVIVTRKEGASGDIFKVSHIGTRNLYISGDTKVDNYAEIIKEYINKPAFILPGLDFDPTKKGNNLWVGSTALSSDGKDLIVYCSEDNRLDLGTNVKNLFSVMMDMGAYKNYPINDGSTPARGIIFPMYRNEQERDGNKYFMMYTSPKLADGGDFGNSLNQLKKEHKNIHTLHLEPFKDTEDLKLNRPGINPTTDDYYGFEVHGLMRTQLLVATGAIPVISESFNYKDWSNPGDDYESEDSKRVHIQAGDGGIFGLCGVFGDNDMKSYYGKDAIISGNLKVNGGLNNYGSINTYPLPSDHNLGPNVGRKGGVVVYDDQYRKKPGLLTGDGDVTYGKPIYIHNGDSYKPATKKYTNNGIDFYDNPSEDKEGTYVINPNTGDFVYNTKKTINRILNFEPDATNDGSGNFLGEINVSIIKTYLYASISINFYHESESRMRLILNNDIFNNWWSKLMLYINDQFRNTGIIRPHEHNIYDPIFHNLTTKLYIFNGSSFVLNDDKIFSPTFTNSIFNLLKSPNTKQGDSYHYYISFNIPQYGFGKGGIYVNNGKKIRFRTNGCYKEPSSGKWVMGDVDEGLLGSYKIPLHVYYDSYQYKFIDSNEIIDFRKSDDRDNIYNFHPDNYFEIEVDWSGVHAINNDKYIIFKGNLVKDGRIIIYSNFELVNQGTNSIYSYTRINNISINESPEYPYKYKALVVKDQHDQFVFINDFERLN